MLSASDGVGWIDMHLNGESLGNLTFCGKADTNPNIYMTISGVSGWIYYNVTDKIKPGETNTATIYMGSIYKGYTKYIYGIVLVVVYEDPSKPEVQYWIREGADYLTEGTSYMPSHPSTTATFPGTIDNRTVESATLWTAAHFTNAGTNDTMWFNDHLVSTYFTEERNGKGFDIVMSDVTEYLTSENNRVKYDKGDDSSINLGLSILVLGKKEEYPDLTVLDISAPVLSTNENTLAVVANHEYRIEATLNNKGTGSSNSSNATLYVNRASLGSQEVPSLEPYETFTAKFTWEPTTPGNHTLEVRVDPENIINESVEYNNYKIKEVYVYPKGNPDLVLTPSDIKFLPTKDSNETTIQVSVRNNGTGDANNFKVSLFIDGAPITNKNLNVSAKASKTISFVYDAEYKSTHSVEIKLDSDNAISESNEYNNDAINEFRVIKVRTIATIGYETSEKMFDIVKLVPDGVTSVEVLESVADVTYDPLSTTPNINGINTSHVTSTWFRQYINGFYLSYGDQPYYMHDGEVALHVYERILGIIGYYFAPRPVMTYPEPFKHGFNGTVWNTTIVYPSGYESIANSIKDKLIEYGVSNVDTVLVGEITPQMQSNNNLILLGTPEENSIIADISKSYYLIGMPVYFDNESLMHDVTTGNVYSTGGVLEACDNPFDNSPDTITYRDTGPSIWIASGVDTESAKASANLLLNPENLDKFWMLVVADLPDLTVSEISLPNNLFANLSNQIKAVISNNGLASAQNFEVDLKVNSTKVDSKTVEELEAGQNITLEFNWTPSSLGDYKIEISVDPNNEIQELNEGNNINSTIATVYENGYTANHPLETYTHGTLKGGIIYTTGNSKYASGIAVGENTSV
ncbi:MAG TPA: DUF3344 domain-containing protein, partial [Methanosarcinales archaeon]|nr:DUF3344 domain-containing protein [Methanosarcinales archaeon]